MFGHIGVRKNNAATINVLNTALNLIEDKDYDVRTAFRLGKKLSFYGLGAGWGFLWCVGLGPLR